VNTVDYLKVFNYTITKCCLNCAWARHKEEYGIFCANFNANVELTGVCDAWSK
jgi:hypothetical protein